MSRGIDDFLDAYVQAALWSSTELKQWCIWQARYALAWAKGATDSEARAHANAY